MRAEVCRLHCRKSIVSVTDGILASHNSDIIIDMGFFAAKLTAGAGTGKKHDKQACYCLAPRPACALWTRLTRTEERDEPASVKDPKVS